MEIKAEKQKIVTYLNSILKNFKGKHIRARNLIIIVIFFFLLFFKWIILSGAVVTETYLVFCIIADFSKTVNRILVALQDFLCCFFTMSLNFSALNKSRHPVQTHNIQNIVWTSFKPLPTKDIWMPVFL